MPLDIVTVQTVKLGIFFFILFTSFLSFQNIITTVYEQLGYSDVGPLILTFNYLSFLVSNTLAVNCKYSFKSQLLIGSLAYSFNMSIGIFVPYIQSRALVYIMAVTGATVGGISAGFLWVSQGGYLRQVCKERKNKGKYNAIFSFLLSFSSLTAGITTTFFLGFFSYQVYFIALTSISFSSSLFCVLFLKNLSQSKSQQHQPLTTHQIQDSLNINASLQQTLQISQSSETVISENSKPIQQSVLQNIINSLKFYKHTTYVLVFLIVDGLCLGIQSNQMPKLIPDEVRDNHDDFRLKAGILTIFIGLGSMIGSYVSGPISDGLGLKFLGKVTIAAYLVTCLLTIAASLEKMYWLASIVSLLWGLTYYLLEGWIFVSIFKIFQGKLEAFAINKQVHCVSMAGFQVFVILTGNKFDIKWLMIGILFFIIPLAWCLFKVDYSNDIYGKRLRQHEQK